MHMGETIPSVPTNNISAPRALTAFFTDITSLSFFLDINTFLRKNGFFSTKYPVPGTEKRFPSNSDSYHTPIGLIN